METLEKVKMTAPSLIDVIISIRSLDNFGTDWTCHQYSKSEASEAIPCNDADIVDFIQKLLVGKDTARLIIGSLTWAEYSNCEGDYIYNSVINATKLPDDRYFVETSYNIKQHDEYVVSF